MKVAVLFSGIPRDRFKQNISDYKEVFNNADFYYHTWHQYNEELEEYKPLITTSEPNPDYNLYENVDDPFVQSTPFRRVHDTHDNGRLSKSFMSKQRRGVIQFYAYNAVYNLIKNKTYDVVIRARYDVKIAVNLKHVFRYLVNKCYETQRPFGFNYEYRRDRHTKRIFGSVPSWDSKIYLMDERKIGIMHYEGYHGIPDYLILHPYEMYDIIDAKKLLDNEQMFSSEPGWWQAISRHKKRARFYWGGVVVERHIEQWKLNDKN